MVSDVSLTNRFGSLNQRVVFVEKHSICWPPTCDVKANRPWLSVRTGFLSIIQPQRTDGIAVLVITGWDAESVAEITTPWDT